MRHDGRAFPRTPPFGERSNPFASKRQVWGKEERQSRSNAKAAPSAFRSRRAAANDDSAISAGAGAPTGRDG